MGNLIYNSPQMIEKPDDLTIEECQEAFDMFRLQKVRKNKGYFDLIMTQANQGFWHICELFFAMFRLLLVKELPMDNLPVMMEKPNDLTLEQCQEAFAMAKAQKVRQCLELIMRSQGLCHIREQIFGYLSYETLENCRKVSKLWDESLERIALIKCIEDRVVAPVSPDPRNPGFLRYFQSPKPGVFFPRNPGVFKQIHA